MIEKENQDGRREMVRKGISSTARRKEERERERERERNGREHSLVASVVLFVQSTFLEGSRVHTSTVSV